MGVEEVLARRLRVLFLDADAAIKMSPLVASLMADELGFNADWITEQIIAFKELAEKYLLKPVLPALEKDLI